MPRITSRTCKRNRRSTAPSWPRPINRPRGSTRRRWRGTAIRCGSTTTTPRSTKPISSSSESVIPPYPGGRHDALFRRPLAGGDAPHLVREPLEALLRVVELGGRHVLDASHERARVVEQIVQRLAQRPVAAPLRL